MSALPDSNKNLKKLKMKIVYCIREYPELYDTTHPNFKNVALKDQLYETIGKRIGFEGSVVKNIFNGLKKEYSNQRGVYEAKLEKGDPMLVQEPSWIFWKPLSFLRENMKKRKRYNLTPSSTGHHFSSTVHTIPILPKPEPGQMIQLPVPVVPPLIEKEDKDYENIDVTKFLVIQTGDSEHSQPPSDLLQSSISQEENGIDSSQSMSNEGIPHRWQHRVRPGDCVSPEPSKRRQLMDAGEAMSDLADAIRNATDTLSKTCKHPDMCALGRYVSAQLALFPKDIQIKLESDIVDLILSKKKEYFCERSTKEGKK